jgi:hypothetical protein
MYKSQILPPGPHFVIRLISMAHFRSKNIFCQPDIKDVQKVHWKSATIDYNLHLKKNVFS